MERLPHKNTVMAFMATVPGWDSISHQKKQIRPFDQDRRISLLPQAYWQKIICSDKKLIKRNVVSSSRVNGGEMKSEGYQEEKLNHVDMDDARTASQVSTSVMQKHKHNNDVEEVIPSDLVQALDLTPLLMAVAQRCGTSRGYRAVLGLLENSKNTKSNDFIQRRHSRRRQDGNRQIQQRQMMAALTYRRTSTSNKQNVENIEMDDDDEDDSSSTPMPTIIKLSSTSNEAQEEYRFIEEAMHLLAHSQTYPPPVERVLSIHDDDGMDEYSKVNGSNKNVETVPPIYSSFSSPWENNHKSRQELDEDEDDEWWLEDDVNLNREISILDLEEFVTAEQVAKRILKVHEWSKTKHVQRLAPQICQYVQEIFCEHNISNKLTTMLHGKTRSMEVDNNNYYNDDAYNNGGVAGAVEVAQGGRTLIDPTKQTTYRLRLSSTRFSTLEQLRWNEEQLVQEMTSTDFSNTSTSSTKSNGASDKDQILNTKLEQIRDDILQEEESIKYKLRLQIASANKALRRGLHLMGRLDVLMARASFGYHLNGHIPIVQTEGIIEVNDFIHPVLALQQDVGSSLYDQANDMNGDSRQEHSSMLTTNNNVDVVPITLNLTKSNPSLIISGPNGGGKSCALKSFGLAAIMCRLGIPISVAFNDKRVQEQSPLPTPRVDFFHSVLVDLSDTQDILAGQSTLMAKLSASSRILQSVNHMTSNEDDDENENGNPQSRGSPSPSAALVLLDELGSGTDPTAGAAISRAILEELMECSSTTSTECRVVVTTHLPDLKFLPRHDTRFRCASVLLQDDEPTGNNDSKHGGLSTTLPSFRLSYDTTGESYALGAAVRCQPPFPRSVIEKAATLLTNQSNDDMDATKYLSLQDAMQMDRDAAERARIQAESLLMETQTTKEAMLTIAKQYETRFSRLEHRLEEMYRVLQEPKDDGEQRDVYDVVGDTLSSIRLVKRRAQTDAELLAERGLKMISMSYPLKVGEQVVIIAKDHPWEGESATVVQETNENGEGIAAPGSNNNEVLPGEMVPVQLSLGFGLGTTSPSSSNFLDPLDRMTTMKFSRNQLAVWSFPDNDTFYGNESSGRSNNEKRSLLSGSGSATYSSGTSSTSVTTNTVRKVDNLLSMMDSLSSTKTKESKVPKKTTTSSNFVSSRQRKAAAKKKKKQ